MHEPRRRPEPLHLPLGAAAPAISAKVVSTVLAAALVGGAVTVAVGPESIASWVRAAMALVLVAVAGAQFNALSRRRRPTTRWLAVDERGVHRSAGSGARTVVDWREPFGATVLANATRTHLLLAFSSARATRFLSVRRDPAESRGRAPLLLEHAITVGETELNAFDDEAASLVAADAERLLRELVGRAPACLQRLILCDATGDPVVLDRAELRVAGGRIDLSEPLEWRALVFQEPGVATAAVYQATWVRQGDAEVVLVAPMAEGSVSIEDDASCGGDASTLGALDPPPRELRRGIERVFMVPVRRALAGAPRTSRVPSPPPWPLPENRP
jgi:hypothetical protein